MQKEKSNLRDIEILKEDIIALNERLNFVEKSIKELQQSGSIPERVEPVLQDEEFELNFPFKPKGSIEFGVGESGMAWLGNIVLFIGITFLVSYMQNTVSPVISVLVGFVAVAGLYGSSWITRKSYSFLSKLFAFNGHLLIFYFTLRLHFFQDNPVIKNEILGLLLLLLVTTALLYKAYQKRSQLMAGIVLIMLLTCGVLSDEVITLSGIATVTAIFCMFLYHRFGWMKLTFVFIFLVYLAHVNWLINNPILGNNPEFVSSPGYGYWFFILSWFAFSMLALIPHKKEVSDEFVIASVVWNGLGFTVILGLIVFTYFKENYVPIFVLLSIFCLIYSVILQLRSTLTITASMYVLFGFLSISVAIFGIFGLPESYSYFALQSLLVVSMALWYRSRFIVVMNTFLFLTLMTVYLLQSESHDQINLSYMVVAFVSARIINWKKERLKIKTEMVRNLYLIAGFIMTLITFNYISPVAYITASWIFAAVLFFIASLLLKKKKYRWLAIAAIVASAIRLVFIDMSNIDIGYRVLIFLVLAILSITVSILYTKYFIKKKE
ncbi:hypothetical protein OU798_11665 [Prolixibacteraceae bacterium Z1-6]|uniref:DUF2339 domain-containing protein n=1 Tax=Draconibacterium aestuarii TaxID=2998507 RepID=A0A9X3J619_9BACT|nr:hypothetical protein [Prolixibacteraceae bacterium Z1-6]